MRIFLFSLTTFFISLSFGQDLSFGWRQKSIKIPNHFEYQSVVVQDTVYTIGVFEAGSPITAVDVDPGTSQFFLSSQTGYTGVCFLKKSLLDGTFVSALKLIENTSLPERPKLHVTQQGTIVLLGTTSININNNLLVDFDPSSATAGANSTDSIINITYASFYTLNGEYIQHLEYKIFPTAFPTGNSIYFGDLTENNQNELFLTGDFRGTIDADFTSGTDSIASNGNWDAVVVKIDLTNYTYVWSKTFGGSGSSSAGFIESNDQHIILSGGFSDTDLDLDPSGNTALQNNPAGLSSAFVNVLDAATGNFVRGFSLVGTPNSVSSNPPGSYVGISGLAIDEESNVFIQGLTNANQYIPLDLDPTAGTEILEYYGSGNSFLAKYDTGNQLQWSTYLYDGSFQQPFFGSTIALEGSRIAMTLKTEDHVLNGPVSAPVNFITLNPHEKAAFIGIFNKETGELMDHYELVADQFDAEFRLNSIHMDRFKNVYLDMEYRGIIDFNQFNAVSELDSSNYYVVSPTEVYFTYNSALLKLNWEGDLGMHELTSVNELQVYPNPVSSSVTIKAESNILSYRIYTLNGRLIKEITNLNSQQVTEPLESISTGVYLIHVETQNGQATSRIVKQ